MQKLTDGISFSSYSSRRTFLLGSASCLAIAPFVFVGQGRGGVRNRSAAIDIVDGWIIDQSHIKQRGVADDS